MFPPGDPEIPRHPIRIKKRMQRGIARQGSLPSHLPEIVDGRTVTAYSPKSSEIDHGSFRIQESASFETPSKVGSPDDLCGIVDPIPRDE